MGNLNVRGQGSVPRTRNKTYHKQKATIHVKHAVAETLRSLALRNSIQMMDCQRERGFAEKNLTLRDLHEMQKSKSQAAASHKPTAGKLAVLKPARTLRIPMRQNHTKGTQDQDTQRT